MRYTTVLQLEDHMCKYFVYYTKFMAIIEAYTD